MIALGTHIFAGGFTLGIKKHFDVVGHLEEGPFGVMTARQNLGLRVETDPARWEQSGRAMLGRRRPDLIYCNPPCAAWSKAGTFVQKGSHAWKHAEHYTNCTTRAADIAIALEPRVWVWESVTQAYEFGKPFVDALANRWGSYGYSTTLIFTDLILHGQPQRRPRMFFIAHKGKLPDSLLETNGPCVGGYYRVISKLKDPGQAGALTGVLPVVVSSMREQGRWGSVRQAQDSLTLKYNEKQFSTGKVVRAGRVSFLIKMIEPTKPIGTISGGATIVHPFENRFLSVKECQVLGGWPASYKFDGALSGQYAQVAKAVQPAAAAWLARGLAEGLGRAGSPRYFKVDHRPRAKGKPSTMDYVD